MRSSWIIRKQSFNIILFNIHYINFLLVHHLSATITFPTRWSIMSMSMNTMTLLLTMPVPPLIPTLVIPATLPTRILCPNIKAILL